MLIPYDKSQRVAHACYDRFLYYLVCYSIYVASSYQQKKCVSQTVTLYEHQQCCEHKFSSDITWSLVPNVLGYALDPTT